MLLDLQNVGFSIKNQVIVQDISLQIPEHYFLTIVGSNGAGKSTLLKLMLGLLTPSTGQIIRQKNLSIGYVPQKMKMNTHLPLKVKEFLRLAQPILSRWEQVIDDMSLQDILTTQIANLSGGQWQRVLMARALLRHPDLLILDEPAQNLDVMGQIHFYELLKKIYETYQISIVMVSHDLHLVMSCTQKVVCLYKHICCEGTPEIVTNHPEFIKIFGSSMAQMLSVYQHHHNHLHKECSHE